MPWDAERRTRRIAIATFATVVQLLHGDATGAATVDDHLLAWLRAVMPDWVRAISA